MSTIDGPSLIAQTLKKQGVEYIFGIVGVPVTPFAEAAIQQGITYIGFRNEQAASYAASVVGYLTKKPAVLLTVAGPGLVHGLPGLLNATASCWPLICMSACEDTSNSHKGAFQESPQIEAAKVYSKYAAHVPSLERFPYLFEQAYRHSIYGKPGAVYLELPANLFSAKTNLDSIVFPPPVGEPELLPAHPTYIAQAISLLQSAKRPLVVIGKGAAYSRAEEVLLSFVEATRIPFLGSPMGKGTISDHHPLCVAAARSLALKKADVILIVGARLNWMFGFGTGPSYDENVKFIRVDISPEGIHENVRAAVGLVGDAKVVVGQLLEGAVSSALTFKESEGWLTELREKCQASKESLEKQLKVDSFPLTYHRVLGEIKNYMTDDVILVNEGANTMDLGRLILPNTQPRQRLDAGTLGTMGVGLGYAVAAAIVHKDKKVIAVEGDSAFGFSGLEVETMCRYNLPVCVIIINNNGIYKGVDKLEKGDPVPPTVFVPNARYEKIMEAVGGKGYFVTKADELAPTLHDAIVTNRDIPTVVNIMIKPEGTTPKIISGH